MFTEIYFDSCSYCVGGACYCHVPLCLLCFAFACILAQADTVYARNKYLKHLKIRWKTR